MDDDQAAEDRDDWRATGKPRGVWVLEHTSDPKFPFRLRIYTRGRSEPMLSFFVQDRWPGSNQHIFCLRENRISEDVLVEGEVERVPVVALQRYGRRLSVVLDRPRQKRCDFQIVERAYKHAEPGGPATYEQIFWFTQTAMRQRRPRGVRLHSAVAASESRVRIASDERYPWALGSFATERGPLATGDYALMDDDKVLAVVERKTFDGLLADFGRMDILRQRLLELTAFGQHAVVIEARYEDFLSPEKVHHWSAAFCARAIADLYAMFPRLRLVFCSNRKTAAEWTRSYFSAVWAARDDVGEPADDYTGDSVKGWDPVPEV
ncbi:MAG: ERCC4 domain-containing protein [Chloroflexi bacterium]|nr:ERCC4 domain-containing protein [Chloroflexota bacterium]MBV9603424.1 ERCC4 domain-containing protein [Chloroflexota bacterium]